MLTSMAGEWQVPGISTTYNQATKDILWGREEYAFYAPALISGAIRDNGNTPTTLCRAGLLLGQITSSGKLIQASPTATDGSQNVVGILPIDINAQLMATNEDRLFGILTSGYVKAKSLLIGGNASYGIAGDTYEAWARTQLAPRFVLDDKPYWKPSSFSRIEIVTADRTVTVADHGTLFVCSGGSGAVNFTLPVMTHGLEFDFYNAVDQNITLTSNPADTLVVYNDIAADTVALSTSSEKIGGSFKVVGLSTGKALVMPRLWEGQTMTIAT